MAREKGTGSVRARPLDRRRIPLEYGRFGVRRSEWRVAIERRALLVSRGWVQATLLVVLCGFFILGLLAYRTYMAHPPVPQRVVDSKGRIVYTGRDIKEGQQVFLHKAPSCLTTDDTDVMQMTQMKTGGQCRASRFHMCHLHYICVICG